MGVTRTVYATALKKKKTLILKALVCISVTFHQIALIFGKKKKMKRFESCGTNIEVFVYDKL